jgi:hypothetical protein
VPIASWTDIDAARKATSGATIAGTISFVTSPPPLTAAQPVAAITAPTRPPIIAWDELDGNPTYQVTRFQAIAPTSAAKTTVVVTTCTSTNPCPTVSATFREMKAPTKLSTEASAIACRGPIARVEIEVATTLAVSWKPLVKSNASAVKTTTTSTMSVLIPSPNVNCL